MSQLIFQSLVTSQLRFQSLVPSWTPRLESPAKMAATPDSPAKMAAMPRPSHQSLVTPQLPSKFPLIIFLGGYSTQAPADAELGPGLIASVMNPPLMSVRAAGIPRASALAVTETVPLTSVLPVMAVAILSVWMHTALLRPLLSTSLLQRPLLSTNRLQRPLMSTN